MTLVDWFSTLFPSFVKLLEALARGSDEDEREAMIYLQERIARQKATEKFGPRPE